MARTALQERYGESVYAVISANYRVRLPYGPNGAQLYAIEASSAGLSVTLQDARNLRTGGIPVYTIINRGGSNSFTVKDHGGTTVATLPAGAGADFYLLSNGSAAGGWLTSEFSTAANSPLLMDRQLVQLVYGNEGRTNVDLVRDAQAAGYDTRLASSIQVYVVDDCVIGSKSTDLPAFATNDWPTGSKLRLYVGTGARIVGRGGRGGRGGDVTGLLAQNGAAGGDAVRLSLDTVLLNYGKIQAGGGGGGGGIKSAPPATFPGGGGGGGAGHIASLGGASGRQANGQPYAGGDGQPGTIDIPGSGGGTPAQDGGAGGGPGLAGTQPTGPAGSGGLGGDPGRAIVTASGVTLTKLHAGTIDGAEVAE